MVLVEPDPKYGPNVGLRHEQLPSPAASDTPLQPQSQSISMTPYDNYTSSSENQPLNPTPGLGGNRPLFTYEELAMATNGFSAQNMLGEGGFGCVYKGVLPDGKVVAVKQLKIGASQGEREFQAEVDIISRIHHRYLVSLVGYCIDRRQRLLVYEYVSNGTLDYHLHKRKN